MLVWVLQTGEPLHIDSDISRPMRAMNLSDALVSAGHRVVLWSSAFYHQTKTFRNITTPYIRVSENLEIRLIPSRGYTRNIGPGRIADHAQLALNLRRLLQDVGELPDVAFVGYPPIETAAVMTRWLARRDVPTLLDVKDQWPELFARVGPRALRPVLRTALFPYFRLARRTMRDATGLSAMAESFLEWALLVAGRKRRDSDIVIPLTSPIEDVPAEQLNEASLWWDARGIRSDGTSRVMFVGSHSRAFDFTPVYEAARRSATETPHCEFVICGEGESSPKLRAMMAGLPNVQFPGWIDRHRMVALAGRCQAALAPYRNTEDFEMSVPNKVIDALSLGLPVLSPLGGEVGLLLASRRVGLQYGGDSGRTLRDCIVALERDRTLRSALARNARATYDEQFGFRANYDRLVTHLEALAGAQLR